MDYSDNIFFMWRRQNVGQIFAIVKGVNIQSLLAKAFTAIGQINVVAHLVGKSR